MTDIPKQVDKRVRQEIAGLNRPWRLIKKRDHYFLQVENKPFICVANNSSKQNEWQIRRAIEEIRKL
jgi:hypothetical protein